MVNVEAGLQYLGDSGRYQLRVCFMLMMPAIWVGAHTLSFVFLGPVPKHRCFVPGLDNATHAEYYIYGLKPNDSLIPLEANTGEYASCLRYNNSGSAGSTMNCDDGWVYDTSDYSSSVVSEFDLVCDDAYKAAVTSSIFMTGVLVGAALSGDLSDRLGRKTVHVISTVALLASGVTSAFMPEYVSYTVVRFILGMFMSGVWLSLIVMVMEILGPSSRTSGGIIAQVFFSIGYIMVGVLGYLIHDWMWIELAITLPGVLFLSYYWLVPESIRWLVSQKRYDAAETLMRDAAKVNNVSLPDHVFERVAEVSHGGESDHVIHSGLDLLKTPNMRRKSLNMFLQWFIASVVYYSLSFNTAALAGDVYVNFILSGAVEIPAFVLSLPSMHYLGRRVTLSGAMLVGGGACFAIGFIPADITWLSTTLAMSGKMSISVALAVVYNYSAELFPTVVRNTALGMCSSCGRLGGIIAPFIVLLDDVLPFLSMYVLGCVGFVAGLGALMLPETRGQPLPETLEDGEAFGKRRSTDAVLADDSQAEESKKEANISDVTRFMRYHGNKVTPEQHPVTSMVTDHHDGKHGGDKVTLTRF